MCERIDVDLHRLHRDDHRRIVRLAASSRKAVVEREARRTRDFCWRVCRAWRAHSLAPQSHVAASQRVSDNNNTSHVAASQRVSDNNNTSHVTASQRVSDNNNTSHVTALSETRCEAPT